MEKTLDSFICDLDLVRLQKLRNEDMFKQLNSSDKKVLNLIQANNSELSLLKYNELSCIMSELGTNNQKQLKLNLDHLDNIFDLRSLSEEVNSLKSRYEEVFQEMFPEMKKAGCFADDNRTNIQPIQDLVDDSNVKYLLSGSLTQDQVGLQIKLEDQRDDKEVNLKRDKLKQLELYIIGQVEKLMTTLEQCKDPDKIKINRLQKSVVETSSMFIEYIQSHVDEADIYPSLYNNLAQLNRINSGISLRHAELKKCVFTEAQIQELESQSWGILVKCLQLTLRDNDLKHTESELRLTVSQARVLGQAYAQMAHILLERASRLMKQQSTASYPYLDSILTLASYLLYLSGNFGNILSKVVSINVNPYAKLCQGVFKESLLREMTDVYFSTCKNFQNETTGTYLENGG